MFNKNTPHTLIPLETFKTLAFIDDRDERFARFCLIAATFDIERHCDRRLVIGTRTDFFDCYGDRIFILKEYPLKKVQRAERKEKRAESNEQRGWRQLSLLGFEICCSEGDEMGHLVLLPGAHLPQGERALKITYIAGYPAENAPEDLQAACAELAINYMSRFRQRAMGREQRTKSSEQSECGLPESVRRVLENYKRRSW